MDFKKLLRHGPDIISNVSNRAIQLFNHGRSSPFQIGIVVPEIHTLTSQFFLAFSRTLESLGIFFEITFYPATSKNLEVTWKHVAFFLEQKEYDIILSYGISCTLAAYDLTIGQGGPWLIFTGLRRQKALDLRLVEFLDSSENHLTGILLEKNPFEEQFAELTKLGIPFKKVLIIYNADGRILDPLVEEIEQVCTARKLTLETFEINTYEDYTKSLGSYLDRSDLVLTLRDSFTMLEIETIAGLCKQHNAILCTSDWYSVNKGASMGFGFDEHLIGIEAAYKAFLMLQEGVHPSQVPLTTPPYTYSLRLQEEKNEVMP